MEPFKNEFSYQKSCRIANRLLQVYPEPCHPRRHALLVAQVCDARVPHLALVDEFDLPEDDPARGDNLSSFRIFISGRNVGAAMNNVAKERPPNSEKYGV